MRTTIFIEDELGKRFQDTARQRGQSLSAFLVEAGRVALAERAEPAPPFRLITAGRGGVQSGVNLDRINELLVAEDEAAYGKRR